jgi:type I site-specific restriction-modification system R (restriction) subunit
MASVEVGRASASISVHQRFKSRVSSARPDLVGFVNGVPLVVIELNKPGAGE